VEDAILVHDSILSQESKSPAKPGRFKLQCRSSQRSGVGDSYDNALAETIIGLYKAEVIQHRGPWRTLESVEYATLEWVA
jgi:hypothetical protein